MTDNGLDCEFMKWGCTNCGEDDYEHELYCSKSGKICTGCEELDKQKEVGE